MELHLKIIGWLLIILALFHTIFPRYFNWRQELESLSLVNRQIMYIHTFFIGLIILLIGILCLTSSAELMGTTLGKRVCLGLGIFWAIRLYVQFFGYSSKLWIGKRFETNIHILFSIMWLYFSVIFLGIFWGI
jgi:hypothetical protein